MRPLLLLLVLVLLHKPKKIGIQLDFLLAQNAHVVTEALGTQASRVVIERSGGRSHHMVLLTLFSHFASQPTGNTLVRGMHVNVAKRIFFAL